MKTNKLLLFIALFLPLMAISQTSASKVNFKSLSAQEFKKVIESESVVLFDVRTKPEFDGGHISGSINIDVNNPNFATLVKAKSKGKQIALYCRSGNRSKFAGSKLTNFKVAIYELNYGFNDWQQSGFRVKK